MLVQDYHLALVPRMIRDALPDATVITFWHIPWPNPEYFAICPWREQIVDVLRRFGMQSIRDLRGRRDCLYYLDPQASESRG